MNDEELKALQDINKAFHVKDYFVGVVTGIMLVLILLTITAWLTS